MDRVKVLGYFDLILTAITMLVIGYVYINNADLVEAVQLKHAQRAEYEREMGINQTGRKSKKFWLPLMFFGIVGLIGIIYCVVTVLREKFMDTTDKEKRKTFSCWLWFNALVIIILSILWAILIFFWATGHESVVAGPMIQIPIITTYSIRLLLFFLIWRQRKEYSWEGEVVEMPVGT